MTKRDLLRMHLRLLVLLPVAVACVLICNAHICDVARRYEYRLEEFAGVQVQTSDVTIQPEGMARVAEAYEADDTVPVIVIEGQRPDKGTALVALPDQGMQFVVEVLPNGVVITDEVNFMGWEYILTSVIVLAWLFLALCVWNIVTLVRHSWYGYEMAAYAGAALFIGVQAIAFTAIPLTNGARTFLDLAFAMTSIADTFVRWSLLPMGVIALFVSLSNIELVRKEGRGLANLLGIAASVAYAAACFAMNFFAAQAVESLDNVELFSAIDSVVAAGVAFAVALFLGSSLCAWFAAIHVPSFPRTHLMILGCGLRADGSPTPLLAGRVDAARAYAARQVEAGYPAPRYVPSGGKGDDEVWAEAESMRRYLCEQGVADAQILPEDRSTNTRENFAYSAQVIARSAGEGVARVAFATTNYHVFRGYVYAHDAGLQAEGIAAPTKLYFWPNAFLREFVGLLAARWLPILVTYLVIAALYAGMEYVILLS